MAAAPETALPPASLDQAELLAEARRRAGLEDFGDEWLFEPLGVMLEALKTEARLSETGTIVACESILAALVNRLRFIDLLKRHPEIHDEEVRVAAVVVGLPRTGSTMLHRMLAAAPGMTAVKWFEAQIYAPFPGEERGRPDERRKAAEGIMALMFERIPELMSIHPMSLDAPDEEVIILGQMFVSWMIESSYFVPSYARWLDGFDQGIAYRELVTILKMLQWLDPARKGAKWVLKTPSHLTALDAVIETFPEALVVMTHRDPLQTVPSYASMMSALYHMGSDEVDRVAVGAHWEPRLAQVLERFMEVRARRGEARFVDVRYKDLLSQPVVEAERVLARAGIPVTPEIEASMQEWIEGNARESRAAHKYTLEEFGLAAAQIERDFAAYKERFID